MALYIALKQFLIQLKENNKIDLLFSFDMWGRTVFRLILEKKNKKKNKRGKHFLFG